MPLMMQAKLRERYRPQAQLGNNGERSTWLATDLQTGDQVTLKTLHFTQSKDWEGYEKLARQAQALRQLNHPNIPEFYDSFWLEQAEGNYFCLVQRYIQGQSLAERIATGERFDRESIGELAVQLLSILEYLHEQAPPIVHRDIKPGNLILGEDGRVYLIDFGVAQLGASATMAAGTYGYMPPEQFLGKATPASDLFGLGATLIHLITGCSPADLTVAPGQIALPAHPVLTDGFGSWLQRMVANDPLQRFKNAREARLALEQEEHITPDTTPILSSQRFSILSSQRLSIIETGAEQLHVSFQGGFDRFINSKNEDLALGGFLIISTITVLGGLTRNKFLITYASLIFLSVCFVLSSLRRNLKIDAHTCSIEDRLGPFTVRRTQFKLATLAPLTYTGIEADPERSTLLSRTFTLRDNQSNRKAMFTGRIKDTELIWLLGQFESRRTRALQQLRRFRGAD